MPSTSRFQARLALIMPLIEQETRRALQFEATLESANDLVRELADAGRNDGAGGYNMVRRAVEMSFALAIAKLFELPHQQKKETPLERDLRSDVASVSLLINLLRDPDCRAELIEEARQWTTNEMGMSGANIATCERAIDESLHTYDVYVATVEGKEALIKLKEFRNRFMAHTLTVALSALPKYDELFALADVARDVVSSASLAVGRRIDLRDFEDRMISDANEFWLPAIKGIVKG